VTAGAPWLRALRGHLWFVRRFGVASWYRYEAARLGRERETGEGFDPIRHGERMLRALGATEEQIAEARARGLA
jgi:hypothetical protein